MGCTKKQWIFMGLLLCGIYTGAFLSTRSPDAGSPRLFFSEKEIPSLRDRVRQEVHAEIWEDILARADQFADPASAYSVFPDRLDEKGKWMLGSKWPKLAGRMLSVQAEALGPAFWLTREMRYGERGKELLLMYAERCSRFSPLMKDQEALAYGEMMRGLAEAYDFFSPLLSPEERQKVAKVCAEYIETQLAEAEEPAWYNPNSNWQGVLIGGAGLLAIAVQDEFPEDAPGWIERSTVLIQAFMDSSFGPDGDYSEHGYIEYAMVNLSLFSDALYRNGGPELFVHPHVRQSVSWLVQDMVPGTTNIESRNDTQWPDFEGYGMAMPWALRMAGVNNDGLSRWLWDQAAKRGADFPNVQLKCPEGRGLSFFRILWANDVIPVAPENAGLPLAKFFKRRSLSVWRTGWSPDDVFFSIESGKAFPVTHDQADAGHFNIYAFGQCWAGDPGYGNRKKPGDRSQGTSHSLVQIDGESQALVGSGLVVGGESRQYKETSDSCYVLCDATDAYNFYETRKKGSFETERKTGRLAAVVQHACRHALYVKPSANASAYLVLCDDIQKDAEVRGYSWQMIADPGKTISFDGSQAVVLDEKSGDRMSVYGWTPSGGVWGRQVVKFTDKRRPASVPKLTFSAQARNPYFITLLCPQKKEGASPSVRFESSPQSIQLTVEWPERTDRIVWDKVNAPVLTVSDRN